MSSAVSNSKPVVVVGAGLAGSLLAVFLRKRGFEVTMYERRVDMRKEHISAGRSINLAMSERAMNALRQVGLVDSIMEIAIPMRGRMMHAVDGKQTYQSYSADGKHAIYSVSRGELNRKLMTLAEESGAKIHFEHKCVGIDFKTGAIKFGIGMDRIRSEQGNQSAAEVVTVEAQTTIGADGAFSGVRRDMFRTPRFSFSQEFLEHAYKELTIPAGPNNEFQLEKNCLHIWPRGHYMMIALPNIDGSFTCTLFFPYEEGEFSFKTLDTPEKVESFFKAQFSDAVPLMPTLTHDFFANPTGNLATIRCFPWAVDGKLALLGDACHGVVPFFGQGMNCAFEDCFVLDKLLEHNKDRDWLDIFQKYQHIRKPNTDAIANMALENFIEMRDKVADPRFLLRKKIEHELEKRYPEQFLSRYEMVSFSNIPYANAYLLGATNDKVLEELLKSDKVVDLETVDWNRAKELVDEHLPVSWVTSLTTALNY
eukprot:TRINITY_DN4684_c0_g5_i1.p1 TRINITY_DN4684_c0_g5~~TRINITY_DN4684_c0_g5_i1.p1  ORF type:complete len:481 (+),score=104.61 TRINITY_DN4684_c0_g5_i1:147-1589(+)